MDVRDSRSPAGARRCRLRCSLKRRSHADSLASGRPRGGAGARGVLDGRGQAAQPGIRSAPARARRERVLLAHAVGPDQQRRRASRWPSTASSFQVRPGHLRGDGARVPGGAARPSSAVRGRWVRPAAPGDARGRRTTTVRFEQTYRGVPVYRAETTVSMNRASEISFVMNGYKHGVSLPDVTPTVAVGGRAGEGDRSAWGCGARCTFDRTDLVVYHGKGASRLAHRLRMVPRLQPIGDWEALVDAKTGELLPARGSLVLSEAAGGHRHRHRHGLRAGPAVVGGRSGLRYRRLRGRGRRGHA